jgi:predicted nucleic acid-binding Zn finger protein
MILLVLNSMYKYIKYLIYILILYYNTLYIRSDYNIPMQQLKIEHKKLTTDQVIENTKKDRREGKGRVLAISRNVFRLQNTDNMFFYYVESESRDDHYYLVKFKQDVLESSWYCSCKDNSTRRGLKCKHLFAIEFAREWGIIKDIEKQPSLLTSTSINNELGRPNFQGWKLGQTNLSYDKLGETNNNAITNKTTKSYLEDDYDL